MGFISSVPMWVWVVILTFLFGALSYLSSKGDLARNERDWEKVQYFEPVLGASPWSFITTPLYRLIRLIGVDLLSTHGVFLGLTTWLVFRIDVVVLKEAWLIPGVELGMWFLACINFAMPDQRVKAIDSVVSVIQATASFLKHGKIPPPVETTPTKEG
jgi:hypothetical protein